MSPVAITYRTGTAESKLRTVIVDDARTQVVLLPTGRLSILTAKLLCGSTCATGWWNEVLGLTGGDFAIPAGQVVQTREIRVATIAKHNH
jgi:hypothetical protein